MKTNTNRATHKGTCQICGCTQLLPKGRLSLHGYTTKWGFFSGICAGANHLPFEQSKDQIAAAVAHVEADIKATEAEIAQLRDINSEINDGSKVWCNVYFSRLGHVWKQLQVEVTSKTCEYTKNTTTSATAKYEDKACKFSVRPHEIGQYDYAAKNSLKTVREWSHYANESYARHLGKTNAQRRDYVNWQNARMANWTPQPLTPR